MDCRGDRTRFPVSLPAGELRMAIGVQYRSDEYRYHADDALRTILPDGGPDVVGFEAADDIDADDHNTDIYVEAAIPLLADRLGVKSLEAVLGYRYSDYASAGGVDTWKAELLYQPTTTVRLRGSYQRAVRVPSIFELFLPGTSGFVDFDPPEPCSSDGSQRNGPDAALVEALCVEQGMPVELLPDFSESTIVTTISGNPDLGPETADTVTAGFVVRPGFESPWVADLQFTIDWYRIDIDEVVTYVDAGTAVLNCFDPVYNPAYAVDNYWCTLFGRDPGTGEIVDAVDTYLNLATQSTSGIDFQLDWSLPVGPGVLGVGWYVGWLDTFELQTTSGIPADQYAGTIGAFVGSYPEWKWLANMRYSWRDLDVGLSWQYVDSTVDNSRFFKSTDVKVPHRDYFGVDVGYSFNDRGWLDGVTIRAGVANLADEAPPIFPLWPNANTDPSQFDVLGRRYFVTMALQF